MGTWGGRGALGIYWMVENGVKIETQTDKGGHYLIFFILKRKSHENRKIWLSNSLRALNSLSVISVENNYVSDIRSIEYLMRKMS